MNPADKKKLRSLPKRQAGFIEPMDCEPVSKVPDGPQWTYEIKFDGYRAIAVSADSKLSLLSRNRKSFNKQFPGVVNDLKELPDGCVLDGEVVGLDESGRPAFNLLQNYQEEASRIHYFIFDLVIYQNRDLTRLPLSDRQSLLRSLISFKSARIHIVEPLKGSAVDFIEAIRKLGLEGAVAKTKDSSYQPGERTGQWVKHRLSLGQEFVIGGFMPGLRGVDALIVGFYRDGKLVYAASIRAGLIPGLRRRLFDRLSPLRIGECPFINLPEKGKSRWGEGLTTDKMKKCVWVQPEVVAQIEFLEWTDSDHLRHAKFVRLRDDKEARKISREQGSEC